MIVYLCLHTPHTSEIGVNNYNSSLKEYGTGSLMSLVTCSLVIKPQSHHQHNHQYLPQCKLVRWFEKNCMFIIYIALQNTTAFSTNPYIYWDGSVFSAELRAGPSIWWQDCEESRSKSGESPESIADKPGRETWSVSSKWPTSKERYDKYNCKKRSDKTRIYFGFYFAKFARFLTEQKPLADSKVSEILGSLNSINL